MRRCFTVAFPHRDAPVTLPGGFANFGFLVGGEEWAPHRYPATWANAEARRTHGQFYDPGVNREIGTRSIGGVESPNDSIRRFWQSE